MSGLKHRPGYRRPRSVWGLWPLDKPRSHAPDYQHCSLGKPNLRYLSQAVQTPGLSVDDSDKFLSPSPNYACQVGSERGVWGPRQPGAPGLPRRLATLRLLCYLQHPGLEREINHKFFNFLFAFLFLLPLNSVEMKGLRDELKIASSIRMSGSPSRRPGCPASSLRPLPQKNTEGVDL